MIDWLTIKGPLSLVVMEWENVTFTGIEAENILTGDGLVAQCRLFWDQIVLYGSTLNTFMDTVPAEEFHMEGIHSTFQRLFVTPACSTGIQQIIHSRKCRGIASLPGIRQVIHGVPKGRVVVRLSLCRPLSRGGPQFDAIHLVNATFEHVEGQAMINLHDSHTQCHHMNWTNNEVQYGLMAYSSSVEVDQGMWWNHRNGSLESLLYLEHCNYQLAGINVQLNESPHPGPVMHLLLSNGTLSQFTCSRNQAPNGSIAIYSGHIVISLSSVRQVHRISRVPLSHPRD